MFVGNIDFQAEPSGAKSQAQFVVFSWNQFHGPPGKQPTTMENAIGFETRTSMNDRQQNKREKGYRQDKKYSLRKPGRRQRKNPKDNSTSNDWHPGNPRFDHKVRRKSAASHLIDRQGKLNRLRLKKYSESSREKTSVDVAESPTVEVAGLIPIPRIRSTRKNIGIAGFKSTVIWRSMAERSINPILTVYGTV